MTQPSIPDQPPFGSVEEFVDIIRSTTPDLSGLHQAACGVFEGVSNRARLGYGDAEVVRHLTNAVAAYKTLQAERLTDIFAVLDSTPVHYLEPGYAGDDDDRMACGLRFGDAVKTSAYTGVPGDVTCSGCRPVADEWSE